MPLTSKSRFHRALSQINLGTESKSRLFVLRANAASRRLTNGTRGKPSPIDKPFSSCNRARRRTASRQRRREKSRKRLRFPPSQASCSGRRNCTGSNCPRRSSPYPRDECRTEDSSNIAIYRKKINKIKRRRCRRSMHPVWSRMRCQRRKTAVSCHIRAKMLTKITADGISYFLN